jgi:predicted transcriptional regulator
MGTTTIRVDSDTHARLVEMSRANGTSLIDTVREAAEALRRLRFAQQVVDELAALQEDGEAWGDYLAEAQGISVSDGID